METIVILVIILVLFLAFIVKGMIDKINQEKQFVAKLKTIYGGAPDRSNPEYSLEGIAKFDEMQNQEHRIDDITWNDLSMDKLFRRMNYCYSSAGEERLYYMLRNPLLEQKPLDEMEGKIRALSEREEERIRLQVAFAKIGRTGKHSIFEYLKHLKDLGKRSNLKHLIPIAILCIGTGVIMVDFSIGLLIIAGTLIYNIITYYKERSVIDPYIISFEYVIRMLRSCKILENTKSSIFEDEIQQLQKLRQSLSSIMNGAMLISNPGNAGSSNPLDLVVDYLKFILHIDIIRFNSMLHFFTENEEKIVEMLKIIGSMEATVSIAMFRGSLPQWCEPQFCDQRELDLEEIYHCEIENPVCNDLKTEKPVLLTGSNASGKSTFLKTVAINAILAQTIHTCMAKRFHTSFYRIYTSMSLRDNLETNESYYMVEIKSMKRIMDAAKTHDTPVLCFVDEVLRGTNTVERISASTEILKLMAENDVMAFAATHDIELTLLLKEIYNNYHFEETMTNDDVVFEYKIHEGPATTRNAIKLLKIMGYDSKITDRAEELACRFLETGNWN